MGGGGGLRRAADTRLLHYLNQRQPMWPSLISQQPLICRRESCEFESTLRRCSRAKPLKLLNHTEPPAGGQHECYLQKQDGCILGRHSQRASASAPIAPCRPARRTRWSPTLPPEVTKEKERVCVCRNQSVAPPGTSRFSPCVRCPKVW